MSKKVYIFSNGTQFSDWQASNCARCTKSASMPENEDIFPLLCEIESALYDADFDNGMVTEEIMNRSGYESGRYVWCCNEVDWTEEWKNEYSNRNNQSGG